MEGYRLEGYHSQEAFFQTHITRRYAFYDRFICQHLSKEEIALSVASGRCANELLLLSHGYNIVCSDLAPVNLKETISLFSDFRFQELDILDKPSPTSFDSIIALGLIYLFDEKRLVTFFENISESLKTGGHLILDGAGPPDNFFTFLLHGLVLRYEIRLLITWRRLKNREGLAFVKKHHGFLRTDREIIEAAASAGLIFLDQCSYDFLTEFRRSYLFSRFTKDSGLEKLFERLGRFIPHVRMFYFQKAV